MSTSLIGHLFQLSGWIGSIRPAKSRGHKWYPAHRDRYEIEECVMMWTVNSWVPDLLDGQGSGMEIREWIRYKRKTRG